MLTLTDYNARLENPGVDCSKLDKIVTIYQQK